MSRAAPTIAGRGVTKQYLTLQGKNILALDEVSIVLTEGEFLALVGPSGCGKSTLLKILAGLIPPTRGHVLLHGQALREPSHEIGLVFQDSVLFPWRTVLENIMLPADIRRADRLGTIARARELLDLVGLTGFEGQYPYELSGGMQQRVAIARALLLDPAILMMDEPFGALDAMTREQLNLELLSLWQARRKSILFVTHSIPEAVFLGDRVLVMSPRPGCFIGEVRVDLPRPRQLGMMTTERFGELVAQCRDALEHTARAVRVTAAT